MCMYTVSQKIKSKFISVFIIQQLQIFFFNLSQSKFFTVQGAEIDLHKITTNKNYFICMVALVIVEMGNMKASEIF